MAVQAPTEPLLALDAGRPIARRVNRLAAALPAAAPLLLAAAYVGLLATRLPQIVAWENADSDVASAFTLTEAISHGHTGTVVLSTQGSWVPLVWGLLTHGLAFHRVVWELSPAALMLATAVLIGWSVAQVAGRSAGLLTLSVIIAASPVALITFTSAFFHNTTIPGAALLDAYLIWLMRRARPRVSVIVSALVTAAVVGAMLASDELLAVVGLAPFLLAGSLGALRTRSRARFAAVVAVVAGASAAATAVSRVVHSLQLLTTTPKPQITAAHWGIHLAWLVQGVLRMGNGLAVVPQSGPGAALTAAAALVTVAAVVGALRIVRFGVSKGAFAAYVFTDVAVEPSDRYIIIAVPALAAPALAALVPLARGELSRRLVPLGACVFICASIVSLARGDTRAGSRRGRRGARRRDRAPRRRPPSGELSGAGAW